MPVFIIILRYVVPMDVVETHTAAHRAWLDDCIEKGLLEATGAFTPRNGGALIAKAANRAAVQTLLEQDPFYVHGVAEYQVFEWAPTKFSPAFKTALAG